VEHARVAHALLRAVSTLMSTRVYSADPHTRHRSWRTLKRAVSRFISTFMCCVSSLQMILAIDTTSEPGSLALVNAAQVIEEVILTSPDGYAHILFTEIESLLNRHDLVPSPESA
jgi:hypothetical protein